MTRFFNFRALALLVALSTAAYLSMFPLAGHPAEFSQSAAVVLITLVLWSTSIYPPFLPGLIFFSLCTIFSLLPPTSLFAGFGSTAVWLIISGFVIGTAITISGLSKRLADTISPLLTTSYAKLITGLVITAMLLGFIMPSSVGRSVVLIPIGMAIADSVGFERGSKGRSGIAVALAIACNMPSFAILPSNIPNMILAGASDTLFGISFGYLDYLLLHFPILGIVKSILLILLVLRFFPATINSAKQSNSNNQEVINNGQQKRVGILLAMTLLFWVTDTWHGVNPAWVGLATAILLLLPKYGVVPPKAFNTSVDFGTVVFVAAALGLGTLVNQSGIGASVGHSSSQYLPASKDALFMNFMSLSIISTLTGLIATIPGVPTVLTPLASDFAQTTGFSLDAVLMTQVLGFSTVIFPYQVGPLIVAMQLSKEKLSSLIKITVPLAIVTVLFIMPLDYLWWRLLGWI